MINPEKNQHVNKALPAALQRIHRAAANSLAAYTNNALWRAAGRMGKSRKFKRYQYL